MSIAELVFLLLSRKKALIKFILGSSVTYGAYFGAIRPSISNAVEQVDGSNILQGKYRDSIKLAKAPIPKVNNALELTTLKNLRQNQNRFHPSLVKYLGNERIIGEQKFDWHHTSLANKGKIREYNENYGFCWSCSTLSDKDITQGESFFSQKVNELKETELVQDILWSLWEESQYRGTVIHAETIKVDFQIDRNNKTPEVKQFSLSFKVTNLSGKKTKVLKSIELDPHTQTEVNILLSSSELRPTPVAGGTQGFKYTSWNLFPKNAKWSVLKNIQQPNKKTIAETYDSLQLIYGSSRFIEFSISRNDYKKIAINTIDYGYVKDKLTTSLNLITEAQVKEDIESWYGGYVAYLIRTRIVDIQNLIDLLQKKTIVNSRGVKESVLEQVLNSYQFRNNLYNHFRLSDSYKQTLNKLLINDSSTKNQEIRITIEEITGLLKSWVYQLKQVQDSIKVEIIWHEQPKKVYSQLGQYGEFPTFAFDFEQKITWIKEMKIPLKGTWDINGNKYEDSSSSSSSEPGKYKFSLTDKLTNLKDILAPLTSTISALRGSWKQINIMDTLIPDVGKFIGIDALTINENESISYTYKTNGSPITLALDDSVDLREQQFTGKNIGWKAIDVSAGLNLSNFTKLFYSLYEKFDSGIKDKPALGITELTKVGEEFKKSPISFIAHAINSIFDSTYGSGSGHTTRQDETKRPWPVFFRSLFADPLVFDHSQMIAGYSKLFFKYPEWWGKENKHDKDCKGEQQQQQQQHWCTSFDFSKKGAIITPASDEVDLISRSLTFNSSMYLPYSPIVLSNTMYGGQYEKFLGSNGAGKTSQGVLNGTKEIVNAVKQEYWRNSHSFAGKREIDWDKAKVSFAQLNLKKAIESVLALKNTLSSGWGGLALTTAGIYFHKILGEALVRDGFWVNINLMHEHGMFTKHDVKVTKTMSYYPNSEIWLKINPSLDHTKLRLGWLVNAFIGKK